MPVRVLVPTPLRPFTGQQAVVAAEGTTVGELLRSLTATHPELRPHEIDLALRKAEDPRVRAYLEGLRR